jgi:DNA-binding FrmR family transcriptional regulator
MIEEGKSCEQTLTQLAAIRSALDQVGSISSAPHA